MHQPLTALRNFTVPDAAPRQQHVLHRDYETRCSDADLRIVGAHQYAANKHTEVICAAFAVDDGPVQLWIPGDPVPPEFVEAARNPNWIVAAHNDAFETAIELHILGPRYGWPTIPIERHICTQADVLGGSDCRRSWARPPMRWNSPTARTLPANG